MSQPAAVPPRAEGQAAAAPRFGDGASLDPESPEARQALAASAAKVAAELAGETADETGGDSGAAGSGAGGSSAGSGGGTGAVAAAPIILFSAFSASPTPTGGPGGSVSSDDESERRPTPSVAEFNQNDELIDVITRAARQRVAPAPVVNIRLSQDGGVRPAVDIPEFSRRTVFGGIVVATSPAATRAVIERRSFIDDFFAGMAARPVTEPENDRPGFLSTDGDQVVSHLLRGMGAEQVRGGQLPEGLLERRSMMPENLAQFKYEALRGAQGVAARPRPTRRDPIMELARRSGPFVVPNSMLDEMNDAFPDAMTVGYDDSSPALAGEILAAVSRAESLIIEREQEQRAQRAKLQEALRALWAERHDLVNNWDGSEQQQNRLAELDQRIGTLVGLVQLSEYARRELDAAYHATQSAAAVAASPDVSAADLSAAPEVDAAIEQAESVTATAERVAVDAEDQAVEAVEAVEAVDPAMEVAAQDWATEMLDDPEPPEELLTGLAEATLPPEWRITDANPETGEFTLTREPLAADLDPAGSPESTIEHEGPSLDDAVTAEGAEPQSVKVIDGELDPSATARVVGDVDAFGAQPEDTVAPPPSTVQHSAATMRLQPGDDGGDEGGGGGTAASAGKRRGRHRAGSRPDGVEVTRLVNAGDSDESGDERPDAEDSHSESGKKPGNTAVKAEQRRREHVAATGQSELVDDDEDEGTEGPRGEDDAAAPPIAADAEERELEVSAVESESPEPDERQDDRPAELAVDRESEPVDEKREDRPARDELPAAADMPAPDSKATEPPAEPDAAKQDKTVVTEDAPADEKKLDQPQVEDPTAEAPTGKESTDSERPADGKAEPRELAEDEQPASNAERPEGTEPPLDESGERPKSADDGPAATDEDPAVPDPNAPPAEPGPTGQTPPSNQPLSGPGETTSEGQQVSAPAQVGAGQRGPHQLPGPSGAPGRPMAPARSAPHPGSNRAYGAGGPMGMSSTAPSGASPGRTTR